MTANYQVVDPQLSLVWSSSPSPYSRTFISTRSQSTSPFLTMAVLTGYQSTAAAASVRINGTEIGTIGPHPFVDPSSQPELVTFIFSHTTLVNTGFPWLPAPNALTIVPKPSLFDWVMVGDVIYHFTS